MNLAIAVAIFATIAVILLIIFCLATKYFSYKLKRIQQEPILNVSTMNDISSGENDQDNIGGYDAFMQTRKSLKMHKADRTEESLFEIADVNDLVNTSSDFYGVPMIKTKHTRDVVPIKDDYTMGSFERTILRPRKGGSKFRCQIPDKKDGKQQNKITLYKAINTLASYNEEGIYLLQVQVDSICKSERGQIIHTSLVAWSMLTIFDKEFDSQLEILGFNKEQFATNKYETIYEIPGMKTGQWYSTKTLKTRSIKEKINLTEFDRLKEELLAKESS